MQRWAPAGDPCSLVHGTPGSEMERCRLWYKLFFCVFKLRRTLAKSLQGTDQRKSRGGWNQAGAHFIVVSCLSHISMFGAKSNKLSLLICWQFGGLDHFSLTWFYLFCWVPEAETLNLSSAEPLPSHSGVTCVLLWLIWNLGHCSQVTWERVIRLALCRVRT